MQGALELAAAWTRKHPSLLPGIVRDLLSWYRRVATRLLRQSRLGQVAGVNHWVGPVRDFESLAKRRARGLDGLGGSSGPESSPMLRNVREFRRTRGEWP